MLFLPFTKYMYVKPAFLSEIPRKYLYPVTLQDGTSPIYCSGLLTPETNGRHFNFNTVNSSCTDYFPVFSL